MTLLLIAILIILVLALSGPTYMARRPSRRRVVETTYDDDPI
ncbi:MAG TPA: hypothetical protein VM030_03155 [Acidimicrobiales bacterium]|nr:hypothetical protein [Acidimicrobiales bacterium]